MDRAGNGNKTMKVLIADDHGIVRSGLRMLLERHPDIEVVGEASDGAQARDMAIRERPDLAILDVKMPKLTGLQATREIRAQAPGVAVLILSMYDDQRYLFEALKAGASGYVLKSQADSDLLQAVRAVERGEPFLTPEAQRALIQDVLGEGSSREEDLTPREQEVVKLVAEAHTNREIAEILHLSEKTVENHRSNAMRKLGMRDRVELVRYAIRPLERDAKAGHAGSRGARPLRDPQGPDRALGPPLPSVRPATSMRADITDGRVASNRRNPTRPSTGAGAAGATVRSWRVRAR